MNRTAALGLGRAGEGSGLGLVLAGAALISFSGVFVKLAHVGPTMAGFYRTLFGGALLAALVLAKGGRLWQGGRNFRLAALCGLLFGLDLTVWHRSINYVGPGLATILANFQVLFLAGFGGLFFGERLGWRYLSAIPLALVGLYLLVGLDPRRLGAQYHWGLFFGLLTAVFYSSYLLALRRLQAAQDEDAGRVNVMTISLLCAVFLGLEAWGQGESFVIPDLQSWGALIAYGLAGQVLGWVLISRGLPRAPASRAGLVLLLQPALAFVWDVLFFSRPTTLFQALGAVGALGAIYLGATSRR